jgi:hypothetical protein
MTYRVASALSLMLLTGCISLGTDPVAAPSQLTVDTFGSKQDLADIKVSSAIAVARSANAAGDPKTVDAELGVAASYLPDPSEAELALAKLRSIKADPAEYAKAEAAGKSLLTDLNALWDQLEIQQRLAAKEIAELKAQLNDKAAALEAERKDKVITMITLVGGFIMIAGAALLGLGNLIGVSKINAIAIIIAGGAITSLSWILDSAYFAWIAGITLSLAAAGGIYYEWSKIRRSINTP